MLMGKVTFFHLLKERHLIQLSHFSSHEIKFTGWSYPCSTGAGVKKVWARGWPVRTKWGSH